MVPETVARVSYDNEKGALRRERSLPMDSGLPRSSTLVFVRREGSVTILFVVIDRVELQGAHGGTRREAVLRRRRQLKLKRRSIVRESSAAYKTATLLGATGRRHGVIVRLREGSQAVKNHRPVCPRYGAGPVRKRGRWAFVCEYRQRISSGNIPINTGQRVVHARSEQQWCRHGKAQEQLCFSREHVASRITG